MFEGKTTIKFSQEAAMLMMSRNLSDMFKMPLEVTAMDMGYDGLEVKFKEPQGAVKEKQQAAVARQAPEMPAEASEEGEKSCNSKT